MATARGEALSTYSVRIACPKCSMQQTFRGTLPEIGAAVEVWNSRHQRTAHTDESDAAEACQIRARTGGKLRSPAVTHGHRERAPNWVHAG
jgi:hypothetical protein